MTDALTFGRWLKVRRRGLGLTQKELARQVGYALVTLRKVEADELRPSGQMATKLAEALELAPEEQAQFVRFARDEAHWDDLTLPDRVSSPPIPPAHSPEQAAPVLDDIPAQPALAAVDRSKAKTQPAGANHDAVRSRRGTRRTGAAAGRPRHAAGHDPQRRRHGQDQPGHRGGLAAGGAVRRRRLLGAAGAADARLRIWCWPSRPPLVCSCKASALPNSRWATFCELDICCWCWTTSNICWRVCRSSGSCSPGRRSCGSWSPRASGSSSAVRP